MGCLPRLHHRPRRRDARTGGRPSPPRRGRERDPRPEVRRGAQSPAVRPLRRQRRLARGPGDRPQSRSLDGAARARRAHRHHPDAPAAALRSRRAADPLCSSVHASSAGALAMGRSLHRCPRTAARAPAPDLTPLPLAARGPAPRARLSAIASAPVSPADHTPRTAPSTPPGVTNGSRTSHDGRFALLRTLNTGHRWIRAYGARVSRRPALGGTSCRCWPGEPRDRRGTHASS